MSKKLTAKASLIQLPPAATEGSTAPQARDDGGDARPKTAPGSMARFMATQSAAVMEAEALRTQLKSFEGAKPVRPLDPQTVRPSRWANRHEHSFSDDAFMELKADIAAAGTNVQPVSVRLAPGVLNGSTPGVTPVYELVFGHRRHRACLELGLPLQAMVSEMSDQALFEAMERENRSRKNLSAWEQGTMYRRALDEGLYPSQRRLAESLGVDVSLVSKSLSLARLPEAVIGAFASPLDIQFRWAQPLAEALQKDPEAMLARAAKLKGQGAGLAAVQVLKALIDPEDGKGLNRSTPAETVIKGAAGKRAVVSRDPHGGVRIQFGPGVLSSESESELKAFIQGLLQRR